MIRPDVVFAIARQDWAQELRGRRGWILPALAGVLLTPLAAAPLRTNAPPPPEPTLQVVGEPGPLADLPAVLPDQPAFPATVRIEGERTVVVADQIPDIARAILDKEPPAVQVRAVPVDLRPAAPGRPLLLTLLAASLMTGALSESLPGERSRKTLEALLTAAVTRWEIVAGKWFAWSSLGVLFAGLSSLVAVAAGQVDAGPWLIAVPAVPMGTVAFGLFMVRRARDVVGGATVALRVLPAALSILGLVAWVLGLVSPIAGACVPLGGALVAAGGTWGLVPTAVAAGLTLAFSLVALGVTTRDLEQAEGAGTSGGSDWSSLLWAGLAWWAGLLGGVAWWPGGNPAVAQGLPDWVALLAGSSGFAAIYLIAVTAGGRPPPPAPRWRGVFVVSSTVIAAALAILLVAPTQPWGLESGWPALAARRLDLGFTPPVAMLPLAFLAIFAQEGLLRGWAQRQFGPWLPGIVGVLVLAPHDPLAGAAAGVASAVLVAWTGRWWLAAAARCLATASASVALATFWG